MKCLTLGFVVATALILAASAAKAQEPHYDVLIYPRGNCDSTQPQPGEAWWALIPGEPAPLRVFFRYDLQRNGKTYLTFYILCDGRIFQAVPPHGDIGYTAFGLIGSISGGTNTGMGQDVQTSVHSWGMRIVITIYGTLNLPVVKIEWPSPSHETDSYSYPAMVTNY